MANKKRKFQLPMIAVILTWFVMIGVLVLSIQLVQQERTALINTDAASIHGLLTDDTSVSVMRLELLRLEEDPYEDIEVELEALGE